MNPSSLAFRRLCLVLPTLALAALVAALSWRVLERTPHGPADWLLALPFVLVLAWESMVVVQVTLGFVSWWRGDAGLSDLERRAERVDPRATGRSRIAIVVPIFDEDVAGVARIVEAMRRSIAGTGACHDIEVHVLSDSRDDETVALERISFAGQEVLTAPAVHYRHRRDNGGRKAGNILEFLERTRGHYDFMVVLDADSLVSGRAIRVLIRLMEDSPRVALIQTISYAAGRSTLFARVQQFAFRLHAHLSLKGMAFWQGADGLYYGHNAIIRCEPFLAHARLPVLPGRPPLGGEILCHDVVEAALLRRAEWEVRVLPDLDGTWEEMPTNLVDLLGRERRWCLGQPPAHPRRTDAGADGRQPLSHLHGHRRVSRRAAVVGVPRGGRRAGAAGLPRGGARRARLRCHGDGRGRHRAALGRSAVPVRAASLEHPARLGRRSGAPVVRRRREPARSPNSSSRCC